MLTVIYKLVSESYLKFLVLTTYDDSDSFEMVSLITGNDWHAVVSDFSKSYRNQITIFMVIYL